MKLPRWLVASLLIASVLVVLGAGARWWVTWPERTAREFVQLIAADQREARNRILSAELKDAFFDWEWERLTPWPDEAIQSYCEENPAVADQLKNQQCDCLSEFRSTWVQEKLTSRSRTELDRFIARQGFTVPGYWFTVERGIVVEFGFVWDEGDVNCLAISW